MKKLHNLLQRYYKRVGNRIVFINGSSLNKLSLEMMEDLGFGDMDPSILSKVINGKRIFSQKQLNSFCKILAISRIDAILLRESLMRDLLTKKGFCEEQANECLVVINGDMIPMAPKIIRSLREGGDIHNAFIVAEYYENLFETDLSSRCSGAIGVYGNICVEKAKILSDISTGEDIIEATRSYNEKTLSIGEATKDNEIINLTHLNVVTNYYATSQWQKVIDYAENIIDSADDVTKSELFRMLLFSYAHRNDKDKLFITINKAQLLVEKIGFSNDRVATITEGISGSLDILGQFKEAETVLGQLSRLGYIRPFYQSEILRGKLRRLLLMKKRGKLIDPHLISYFEKGGKKSKTHGF